MRVVLDTNILISALWTPDRLEAAIVSLAVSGRITVFVSPDVLAEYRDVLFRKKFAALHPRAETLLGAIEAHAIRVEPAFRLAVALNDDDDNRLLECAFAASAQYLITGNLKHYPRQHGATRVVNAREFLTAEGLG